MKPTLEKHVGCDIIDLNPGPGMWSSALHDFLKPRTHILMEPDPIYKPLLQPLLDAEGSTYKLVSKSGLVWNSLQETLSPELLPHQEAFKQGDPQLEEPNNSLLLVANLGYNPQKPYRGFASITNLVMYQLLSAARSHSLFHKYGLVRMLLWVDEEAKRTILPQNVLRRRKAAVEAELSCSDITEVVYSADAVGRMVRDHALDLESSFATLERMRKAGITTPPDRRGPLEIEATERMSKDQDSKFWLKKDFYKELDDHERRFAAGEFTMFMDTPGGRMAAEALEKLEGGPPPSIQSTEWARMMLLSNREKKAQESGKKFRSAEELQGLRERFASGKLQRYPHSLETDRLRRWKFSISEHFTPEYRILEGLRARSVTAGKAENRIEALREEYDAIIAMRKQAANLEGPAAEQLQHEATTRYNAMMEDFSTRTLPAPVAGMVQYMLDNRTAFHQDPPLLYWDRRRAEPLKARPEEFFPKADMALLDFEPRSMWPILRANFPANYDVLEYIVSTLLMLPSQSIRQGFNTLAPGAFEHLIPECPSITDHKRGGSTYLDIMTVRCLTLEMFEEILEAWLKWPFRPSRYYILSKMGSDVYDPDEIDTE
jgi:transcription factor 1